MRNVPICLIAVPFLLFGTAIPASAAIYMEMGDFPGEATVVDCSDNPNGKSDAWISRNCSPVKLSEADRRNLARKYRSQKGFGFVEIELSR